MPQLDPQLSAALIALALLIIGSVGAVVKAVTDHVLTELKHNTRLTEETKELSNGRLTAVLDRLAAERNRVVALRALVRERDDRLAFLATRSPDVQALLSEYGRRRQDRHSRTDEHAALQRLLDDVEDPTGTDAGAHPRG